MALTRVANPLHVMASFVIGAADMMRTVASSMTGIASLLHMLTAGAACLSRPVYQVISAWPL